MCIEAGKRATKTNGWTGCADQRVRSHPPETTVYVLQIADPISSRRHRLIPAPRSVNYFATLYFPISCCHAPRVILFSIRAQRYHSQSALASLQRKHSFVRTATHSKFSLLKIPPLPSSFSYRARYSRQSRDWNTMRQILSNRPTIFHRSDSGLHIIRRLCVFDSLMLR